MNPIPDAERTLVRCFLAAGLLLAAAAAFSAPPGAGAKAGQQVLLVGPGRTYERPSDAARTARDGALVKIGAGDYVGDVASRIPNSITEGRTPSGTACSGTVSRSIGCAA